MKSARNQLILLGLVCQALSWDDYLLPAANVLLWILCLKPRPKPKQPGPFLEASLLMGGSFGSYALGHLVGRDIHFFIGHGLALLQLVRLLRPLVLREKFFSMIIAFFHLGVACTFLFDLRFIVVLALAVVLVPRALKELTAEAFAASTDGVVPTAGAPLQLGYYALIALTTVLFFVGFPRVFLGAQLAMRRTSSTDTESALDSVLDPTRGALGESSKVLLHIEGENLGYLRCLSLTEIKGVEWSLPPDKPSKRLPYVWPLDPKKHLHRRVHVKNALLLGRVLPTDGQVVNLSGNFFWRPVQNNHGGIDCYGMWNTAKSSYDYWINRRPVVEPLYRGLRQAYTHYPPQSTRLRTWLGQLLAGITEPIAQARSLESYFRTNFVYDVGAPRLSRLAPTEDFLFNQRRGHCERFAATLGLLLRMRGIPARVVIGYVPTSRNWFSGGYNIRFKDAHAWTEAYFDRLGWVELDATPRATVGAGKWSLGDFLQDLDLAWSSYVVNFDAPAQGEFFRNALDAGKMVASRLWQQRWIGLGIASLVLGVFAGRLRRQGLGTGGESRSARRRAALVAEHSYGRMLKIFERLGLYREPAQTPFEFLSIVKSRLEPAGIEAQLITEWFCATRYGRRSLSPAQQAQIETALARLRRLGQGLASLPRD